MSQPSSSSSFQSLFNAALQDYAEQTGTRLDDHPFAKQLENCNSVCSISSILQEHARRFHECRGEDGKIMKSLKCTVDVLYGLSRSTLGEGISLPWPPANAIFAAFAILLAAVKDVNASYDALVYLFESIERFLRRLDIYTKVPLTPAMTNVVVKIMVEILSTLALATKQVKQGRLKKFVRKFLKEDEIVAVLHRLDRLTQDEARATGAQTLEVVCGLVQHKKVVTEDLDEESSAHNVREALGLMHKILSDINESKRDELQQNIDRWLSPPDPWKNHNIARESQHSGTAAWWIHGDTFRQWKYSDTSSFLWIHGKPGAGKSVLSSSIIQDIRSTCGLGLATLAFFYCDFRENKKKGRRGLLSSFLVQLCYQSDAYCAALSAFYLTHRRGSQHASDSELLQCLKHLLKLPGQATAYLIIDALDECPATAGLPSPREEVLDLVRELVKLHAQNLRICVTSRPETDIEHVLGPLTSISVSLHRESGQAQDITEYVKFVVNTDPKMRTWRKADKEHVIDVLTTKADGMFRFVFCQLEYLRQCLRQRIQRVLDELPETLDETYDRTLEEIGKQNWEYAQRLFQCVAVAKRPLRVEELAEFLAFDFDAESTPTLQEDWREENPAHTVLSTCSSLLAIVDVDGSSVIQFSHYSVKEYLTSTRLAEAKESISRFHVSMTAAHTIVAQACLGVLLHIDEDITEGGLEQFPLAEYAAEYWVDHARFEGVSQNIQDGMKRLFDPNNHHLSVWVWIYDPESPDERSERPSQARSTALHYAAFYGLHDVVKFLIVEHSQDVNARGFENGETPLLLASRKGHLEAVRVLLEHGAETEIRDNESEAYWSPLERASERGHVKVVQLLLDYHADLKVQDIHGQTALFMASWEGQPAAARLLLEHGADANIKTKDNRTPLHTALNEGAARVLLEYGADANAKGKDNGSPLHSAWNKGVARVLLEYGANTNALDKDDRTPLHWASVYGRTDVARVLLKSGASANSRDSENRTPLHLASEMGCFDVVLLLLQRCSDVHAQDVEGQTPFQIASARGYHEVMQLLLEHGAADYGRRATRHLRSPSPSPDPSSLC